MATDFFDLRNRERERLSLFGPHNQEQSFPDFVSRPFTPAQEGFLFTSQPATPINAPANLRPLFDVGQGNVTGPDQPDEAPDVPDLPGTPRNVAALLATPFNLMNPLGFMSKSVQIARNPQITFPELMLPGFVHDFLADLEFQAAVDEFNDLPDSLTDGAFGQTAFTDMGLAAAIDEGFNPDAPEQFDTFGSFFDSFSDLFDGDSEGDSEDDSEGVDTGPDDDEEGSEGDSGQDDDR